MSRKKRKLRALRIKEEQGHEPNPTRRLTQVLIFSGALNIALATSLIFYVAKNKEPTTRSSYTKTSDQKFILDLSREVSLQKTLEDYLRLDFESLTGLLKESEIIEEGFTQRDLALSVLAYKYDFDIERSLLGREVETRTLSLDQREDNIPLYTNIQDAQYRSILSFLKTEQWPFTSKGLFNRIVQGQSEDSLKRAFFLTKEFMLLEALYCPVSVKKEDLLELIKQGPWEFVQKFVDSRPLVQNFSNPLRVQFLCQYFDLASDQAASLVLKIDPTYAIEKLSDESLVTLLSLLEKKTELTQNFALHLALGSRSDWVKQEACRLLYHYSGREFKHPFNYQEALYFIAGEYDLKTPEASFNPVEEISSPVQMFMTFSEPVRIYTVQPGDCLSRIASKHQIDVRTLKAANGLNDDRIKVGMTLKLP